MDQFTKNYVDGFMADLIARNPGEKEFHQAVKEVFVSLEPVVEQNPNIEKWGIMERIVWRLIVRGVRASAYFANSRL